MTARRHTSWPAPYSSRAMTRAASRAASASSARASPTAGISASGSEAVTSRAAIRNSPRRYAMRRASSGVSSPRSSVTARTRSLRTCSPGRRSARAASTQCSGCRTSSSTRAVEAPSTPRTRSRPTPGAASSAAKAEMPQSGGSPRRARDSATRTSPSRHWSGSAVSPMTAARGSSWPSSTAARIGSSARSSMSPTARSGSANPSRARAPSVVLVRDDIGVESLGGRRPREGRVREGRVRSEPRQVAVELEAADLVTVVEPLLALVAQEEVEDVLAEDVGDELALLHDLERPTERGRQRLDAHGPALGIGEAPDVVLGLGRKLVALLDALEAGAEQDGEGEVGVAGRVERADLDARRLSLVRLVHRHADERRAVVVTPREVGRGFSPAPETLVRVDPLVRHGGDLGAVAQQARDELPTHLAQLVGRAGLEEGVGVALEEREVRVHPGPGVLGERLGHEGRVDPLRQGDLLDDRPEGLDVVGRAQRVGIAKIDLVLAGRPLVVAELDRDTHVLEHRDGGATEVVAGAVRHVVEVAGVVDGDGSTVGTTSLLEEEELDLGVGVEGETEVCGLAEGPLEHVPRVGEARCAVRQLEVAEHACRAGRVTAPGQDLERRRVGLGQHVGLVDASESLDRRTVEADALGESPLELGRRDRNRLQGSEDVREPQTDEPDVSLFDRAQHELFLTVHVSILPHGCFTDVARHDLWDESPVVCRRAGTRRAPGTRPGGPSDS